MVRFVQKRGPFCPEAWSVLSWNVVRFVLRRGPFCLIRFVHGPFCPSTNAEKLQFGSIWDDFGNSQLIYETRMYSVIYRL